MIGSSDNIGLRWIAAEDEYLRQRWATDSLESLSMRLGRTVEGILNRAKKLGLWGERARERRRQIAARRERVAGLFENGASRHEMMAVLHAGRNTIDNDVKALGLRRPRRVRSKRVVNAVRAKYRMQSAAAIAAELRVTRNTVIGTARDLGLCRRRAAR